MKKIILLADNNAENRLTWQRILSNAGYDVKLAGNPEEARQMMSNTRLDLAILDLRLVDDNDGRDISGILIAKEQAFRHIPKIILTAYNTSYSDLRSVSGPVIDELPATVAFVDKAESPQALLELIQQTLENWPRLRSAVIKVTQQIKEDHEEARQQARLNYRAAWILSILAAIIILVGIALTWMNRLAIGIVATAGGIVGEVISVLFFMRVNSANSRMDVYHRELLQTYWFEFLIAAADELPLEKRVVCKEKTIITAIKYWLSISTTGFDADGKIDNQKGSRNETKDTSGG
jgi:CheY-like chemotaxis protein